MPRHRRTPLALLLALVLLLPPLALAPPARAADCVVRNGADSGPDSLRAALARSDNFMNQGCETISFTLPAGTVAVTVSSRLVIARDVTIVGPGAGALAITYVGPATSTGSVFYIRSGTVRLAGLTISGGRTQGIWGAGITTIGDLGATSITLDAVTLRDNIAQGAGGGGIYASNATLTLINTTVSANKAENMTGDQSLGGGGLFLDDYYGSVSAILTGGTVDGNAAPLNQGGGIRVWDRADGKTATLALSGTALLGNIASAGGGIALTGGAATLDRSAVGTAARPNAAFIGGGVHARAATLSLTASTVVGNTSQGSGGGIDLEAEAKATLTVVTIAGNTSGGSGGGIAADRSTVGATNVTISGNTAARDGGGVNLSSSGVLNLAHATVTGNTSAGTEFGGGALAASQFSAINLQSSLVAGNTDRNGKPPDCTGPSTAQGYNLVVARGGCPTGGTAVTLPVGTPAATILAPTLAENGGSTPTHALVPNSPAIDRIPAADCATTTDQRGIARPQGAGCDIGAFEYQPPAPTPTPTPTPTPAPLPSGPPPSFADVPPGYWAHDQIIQFAQRGITTGCDTDPQGITYYCPERLVTRAEMAAFLIRTLTGTTAAPPGTATPTFADVPANHPQYGFIEALVARGITTGCGGNEYCPDRKVSRAEMAAFIIRALTGSTAAPPGPAAATFGDVPLGHPQYGFIESMFTRGITTGCGDPNDRPRAYCPGSDVTRAEMAVFIIRAYP